MRHLKKLAGLFLGLPLAIYASVVDVKTVSVNNGSLIESPVANRLFMSTAAGTVGTNRVPVGTAIWFVADAAGDGIRTSPKADAVLDAGDDVLLFAGTVAGLSSSTPGRYIHEGLVIPDVVGDPMKAIADVDVYVLLWNGVGADFTPKAGSTFGVLKLGKTQFPNGGLGNGFWALAQNVFADENLVLGVGPDNRPPVLDEIGARTIVEGSKYLFSVSAFDPDIGQSLRYSLSAGAPLGVQVQPESGLFTWTPTEDQGPGTFTFTVIVSDNGTPILRDEETVTFTIDEVNGAPILEPIGDVFAKVGVVLSIQAKAQDADLPAQGLSYSVANAPAGLVIHSQTGLMTWTPSLAQTGSVLVKVRVTDDGVPARSSEQTVKITVAPNNEPPVLNAIGARSLGEGTTLQFTASASDPDAGQTLNYTLAAGAPLGAQIQPETGLFTWTPTEDQGPGTFTFTVVVSDNGIPVFRDEETVSVTVDEVNLAPTLQPFGDVIGKVGIGLSIQTKAQDADLPAQGLSYSVTNAPTGLVIDAKTGLITWTPSLAQVGSNLLTVSVTDDGIPAQTSEQTLKILVEYNNKPPVLDAIGSRSLGEGTALQFTASASDPDAGQTLSYSLAPGAPLGAQIHPETGRFNWTPTEDQGPGEFTLTVLVSDNGTPVFRDEETVSITVNEVNLVPTLELIGDVTGKVGTEISIQVIAQDVDLPAQGLSYSVTNAPEGLVIHSKTGKITWTPSTAQAGLVARPSVRVADDGVPPLSSEQTFKISVAANNRPPVLNALGALNIREGTTFQLLVSASDPDAGQSLSFALAADAPLGAQIDPKSGLFRWIPTEEQGPGTFKFTVVVSDNGTPVLRDEKIVSITVDEVNSAPTLEPLGDVTTSVGLGLSIQARARDGDLPAQGLSFSVSNAPEGLVIDSKTGLMTWTPGSAQTGTIALVVRVTDDGIPALRAERSVRIIVGPRAVVTPMIQIRALEPKVLGLTWSSTIGTRYQIQGTDSLNAPVWKLLGEVSATSESTGFQIPIADAQAFYRLVIP